ncbi:hypothetical protein DOY81_010502, partial [Sarcophaga bullata]
ITIVEFFKSNSHKMHSFGNLSGSNYYFLHLEIPDWMVECYKRIGLLIFGSGVCELTTDIAKYSIGRLRPHFFAIYLHKRMTCSRSKMFKHLLQFVFLMFAWYTSLTRVSDYKHHWTDVLAGSLIGTLYAIIVVS